MNAKELIKLIPQDYIDKFVIKLYPREEVLLINTPMFINMGKENFSLVNNNENFITISNDVCCIMLSTSKNANPAVDIKLKGIEM